MLKNHISILPVSHPAKQVAQLVKHHVLDERTVITQLEETPEMMLKNCILILPVSDPGK